MIKDNVGHDGCVPVSFLRYWLGEGCKCSLCEASRKRIGCVSLKEKDEAKKMIITIRVPIEAYERCGVDRDGFLKSVKENAGKFIQGAEVEIVKGVSVPSKAQDSEGTDE